MSIERVQTGIAELDKLLQGGLPKGSMTLIAGGPGTGKTVLAAQFVYNGVVKFGEKGLYILFDEGADTFRRHMLSLGFNFAPLEETGKLEVAECMTTERAGVGATMDAILEKVRTSGAKRLVIDSFTALTLASRGPIEARVVVSELQRVFRSLDCTVMLTTETPWAKRGIGAGVEEFIADGIILLEMVSEGVEFKKRLAVLKMRATEHSVRYYRYTISKGTGIEIIPYPEA
jgi:circadian clock protein KaiC